MATSSGSSTTARIATPVRVQRNSAKSAATATTATTVTMIWS
jgi:hypothetical protein